MFISVPDACTLPTVQQPLRLNEFDALFQAHLRGVERVGPAHLRMTFVGEGAEAQVRDLSAREAACCSFFDFVITPDADQVVLDVKVPAAQQGILTALEGWAAAAVAV